jgi:RNA polymerase sigma-70 factor (ECF subfamily)
MERGSTGRAARCEDRSLVVAIGTGCTSALAVAYDRNSHVLFDTARCLVGQRALAEEVVQDVFVKLWNSPGRFDASRGTLKSYLTTLAYGRAVDVARSEGARRRREEREARLTGRDFTIAGADHDTIVTDELRDALATLRETEREAIAMAYFFGYSYREVASRLDVPEGTVKNRIRTGLARLREHFADDADLLVPMAVSA